MYTPRLSAQTMADPQQYAANGINAARKGRGLIGCLICFVCETMIIIHCDNRLERQLFTLFLQELSYEPSHSDVVSILHSWLIIYSKEMTVA